MWNFNKVPKIVPKSSLIFINAQEYPSIAEITKSPTLRKQKYSLIFSSL